MFATLIPLFDDKMQVSAYSVVAQKKNLFVNTELATTGRLDGAAEILGFDIVDSVGVDVLDPESKIFIEVNPISIFTDIDSLCHVPHERIVLMMSHQVKPTKQYIDRVQELKDKDYRIAMRKLQVQEFEAYKEMLPLVDCILLDHKRINVEKAKVYFRSLYPRMKLCAVNVNSKEDFDRLVTEEGGYDFYEGTFFRMPITSGQKELAPLKTNYLRLLHVVNDPDFNLNEAADIIGQDAALVFSLLKMVNRMTVNAQITSVRHAAAMLGQKELKVWINTAVTKELCADKPSEIVRMTMIRAKFAEHLGAAFGMREKHSELFLMGMFSLLDVMLDRTMEAALSQVNVSKEIYDALMQNTGKLAEVLHFIKEYENASWQEVSRMMVLRGIEVKTVYEAYLSALRWSSSLMEG